MQDDKQAPMTTEGQETQKTGRHMILVAWIIALGMLAFFFSGVLDRQHNPNQQVESSIDEHGQNEVILQRNRQGHYITSGYINDQPVIFLLDTGATVVSVPEIVAKRLGLRAGYASQSTTANGTIETYATRLKNVGIGSIELNNVAAHINPHMQGEEILLGMSFLKNLELIQKGEQMTIRQPLY